MTFQLNSLVYICFSIYGLQSVGALYWVEQQYIYLVIIYFFISVAPAVCIFKYSNITLYIEKDYNSVQAKTWLLLLLIISIYLFYSSENAIFFVNFDQTKLVNQRAYLLDGNIDANTRILGYLSIVSSILYFQLRMKNVTIFYVIAPLFISFLNLCLTIGKGIFVINFILILVFESIKIRKIIFTILCLVFFSALVMALDMLRGNYSFWDSAFILFNYYLVSPVLGFVDVIRSTEESQRYCLTPVIQEIINCEKVDSRTFIVPFGEGMTNVYGTTGWLYLSSGFLGVMVYSTIIILYVKLVCLKLMHLRLRNVAIFNLLCICCVGFYMPVFLFNGFFSMLFIVGVLDVLSS